MKGWVIFAFNLFKIIWGVNPDKILDIFLIVPRVNYQYQETGISQKFTGVKLGASFHEGGCGQGGMLV